jgi:hypothetical protein
MKYYSVKCIGQLNQSDDYMFLVKYLETTNTRPS